MLTVYFHENDAGTWALTKCPLCREVHKYPLRDAVNSVQRCKSCGHAIDMSLAIGAQIPERRNAVLAKSAYASAQTAAVAAAYLEPSFPRNFLPHP